mmetsp:Transcript_10140/g.37118  ORF Transcript_10140/g.37118 Transcript_10140/m.37118 type:complete len:456 (-) Transcript_10140:303-1670(-)
MAAADAMPELATAAAVSTPEPPSKRPKTAHSPPVCNDVPAAGGSSSGSEPSSSISTATPSPTSSLTAAAPPQLSLQELRALSPLPPSALTLDGAEAHCKVAEEEAGAAAAQQRLLAVTDEGEGRCDASDTALLELPEEVLHLLLGHLSAEELCLLGAACHRLAEVTSYEPRWRQLFASRFGATAGLAARAAQLAGGWKRLYLNKCEALRRTQPWVTPGSYEVAALLDVMRNPTGRSLGLVFLVDGSGSVSEPDFNAMTTFLKEAVFELERCHRTLHVGILQFSDEVRIELELTVMDYQRFAKVVDSMVRMNGGTNIASAILRAQQMFEANVEELKLHGEADPLNRVEPPESNAVVLLTDGRLDGTQSSEAVLKARKIATELPNMATYALGVGRSIDQSSMRRLVFAGDSQAYTRASSADVDAAAIAELGDPDAASSSSVADNRYLGLRILKPHCW